MHVRPFSMTPHHVGSCTPSSQEDSSVLVSPACAQHTPRLLCMLKIPCPPFAERKPNGQWYGKTIASQKKQNNSKNESGCSQQKVKSIQDSSYLPMYPERERNSRWLLFFCRVNPVASALSWTCLPLVAACQPCTLTPSAPRLHWASE